MGYAIKGSLKRNPFGGGGLIDLRPAGQVEDHDGALPQIRHSGRRLGDGRAEIDPAQHGWQPAMTGTAAVAGTVAARKLTHYKHTCKCSGVFFVFENVRGISKLSHSYFLYVGIPI